MNLPGFTLAHALRYFPIIHPFSRQIPTAFSSGYKRSSHPTWMCGTACKKWLSLLFGLFMEEKKWFKNISYISNNHVGQQMDVIQNFTELNEDLYLGRGPYSLRLGLYWKSRSKQKIIFLYAFSFRPWQST